MGIHSSPPVVVEHSNRLVVRDDLFPGGTKARYLAGLFADHDELVYATPAEGGAQTALAHCAAALGKRATLFVAKRAQPHARALMAKRLGAKVLQVAPGYLSVVQARAKEYAADRGAFLVPFGADMPEAIDAIAAAAVATRLAPVEVWCAAGSGVLSRGMAKAWPSAVRHVVQVGRELSPQDVAGAQIHIYPKPFGWACQGDAEFPTDLHYDAKAWELCYRLGSPGALFWNVTGPA